MEIGPVGRILRFGTLLLLAALLTVILSGCMTSGEEKDCGDAVDFTVVDQRKLPEELKKVIEENKKEEIRMTYTDGEDLYLIRGYGQQKAGGYSIVVVQCTEDEETIRLDTRLVGPQEQKGLSKDPSCPVLVIKMESRDKEAVIQ